MTEEITYIPWAERGVGQAYVHRSNAKYRTVMAGRQSGKTMVGIAEISVDAMSARHINWWIAPNYKVKPRAWRGLLDFLPPAVIVKKNETENYIDLVNGSQIWVKSADAPDSLVSEGLDFAVCDEAGQWKESAWFQGILPMFAARPHARALLIGTPRGKNWFHRTWLKGVGLNKDPEHESFHWKSEDSPYVSQSFLEEQRRNIPLDTYLQEYEADPLDNASAVFRNFRGCIRTAPAVGDAFSVIGVDLARKLDFSAMIGMNGSRQVMFVERFQDEWSEQKRKIVAKAFGMNARVVMDATGIGDVLIEEVRNAGVQTEGFILSNQSKQQLIDNLRIAFDQGTVAIPNDAILIDELDAYQYEYNEDTRRYKYSAPDGKHDDLVVALALATWGQRGAMAAALQSPSNYLGHRGGSSYMKKQTEQSKWPF